MITKKFRSFRYMVYCLFLVLASSRPLEAVDLKQYNGPDVVVRYEPELENAAANMVGRYPAIKADIESRFGWKAVFVPTIILIRQNSVFRKEAGGNLVTAFAAPADDLVVIDYSKMDRTPFDLEATLKHELCHLLLHHYIQARIPKWLDEGLAQWASGGAADIVAPDEKDILKQAVLSGHLLPLGDISSTFPGDPRGLVLSYEESRSFVEFIVDEYGAGKLLSVLNGFRESGSIEQSVSDNLSSGLAALEQKWRRSLLRRYSWPLYIADNIYWILFFSAAAATIIGYLRFRMRLKRYRDEEDEDFLHENNDEGNGRE